MRTTKKWSFLLIALFMLAGYAATLHAAIPLPEHPRPDFQRPDWINLNGIWKFHFDEKDRGIAEEWFNKTDFAERITVPFPWGAPLSGVEDKADIGWYARKITVPTEWKEQRIFLIIGASDWETTVWLDGNKLGTHQGGYIPFEFELTNGIKFGEEQELVIRVDDARRSFTLYGKQGYGNARGIWQTPYLEARGKEALKTVHVHPDIDNEKISVVVELLEPATNDLQVEYLFKNGNLKKPITVQAIKKGETKTSIDIAIPNARLWSLEDPFLYEVTVSLRGNPDVEDRVNTYFGMRKISVMNLPGTEYPYVALNNKPIYLQMTLDQAYHPEGYYTFPSDEFVRNEVLLSKSIGLNSMRVHIKIPLTRKLYWADKLGMLIMEDIPNAWDQPNPNTKEEMERTMREAIRRDFNHPSIFSWVTFNETWGLFTNLEGNKRAYLPETQEWVRSMYRLAKELDPTRLVEDNSPCNYDHVETDLNTWHAYLPGYEWRDFLKNACEKTFPGSEWNYINGNKQDNDPMFNSECGNVWGYEGSTGDVDWSWDYHIMINEFRRHPKCAGWLYTEHHDVINEWNGYWRYDRSQKFTGMEELVPGMTMSDLHSPIYVAVGNGELCQTVQAGQSVEVPLYVSIFTDQLNGSDFTLDYDVLFWNALGEESVSSLASTPIKAVAWENKEHTPLQVNMPDSHGLAVLRTFLKDSNGFIVHRNFCTYLIEGKSQTTDALVTTFAPKSFSKTKWSLKQWDILDGLKVNGAGSGYFEYEIDLPENADQYKSASLRMEVSAKQLFGKDQDHQEGETSDYMTGGGLHDPSRNKNAYPMTDETTTPSQVLVRINGQTAGSYLLPDDPADHRGILSWKSQLRDRRLREAGSYGYLINVPISQAMLSAAKQQGKLIIRLEVDEALSGGLAIYGKHFGRYPLDPTLLFNR